MKIISIIFAALFFNTAVIAADECFNCHEALGDNPSQLFANDIHHQKGIACSACHGGNSASDDMDIAMDTSTDLKVFQQEMKYLRDVRHAILSRKR